ncbi:ABC transporter substrate-binding protein [Halotalea alkalilenta]|uniref:ABC transporter substrate-binding protein n=1 Tax=Halotalea alkalilenta TaxID=376489 RepID=A0A172YGG5_9GAMM|nr:ABC transporter substrate-binding protein [Halotalea alkalilenta]ANF58304.1 ABC transporter substrate-binding protein [Halotalea alkalilenta]
MTILRRFALTMTLALSVCATAQAQQSNVPIKTDFEVSADPALEAILPDSIRQAGFINIGTNPNTPPTVFYGEDNRSLEGREIDVMTAIAHRLGLKPRWNDAGGFDNIIPGLSTGRYDAALANLDVNSVRLQRVDFVGYFNNNRLGMVVRSDAGDELLTELGQLCGRTVGGGSGTQNVAVLEQQSERCVAEGKEKIDIPLFPDRPSGVQSVVSGRTPAFFGPYEGLKYQASASRGALVLGGEFEVPPSFVGIGLGKDSELTEPVRQALQSLIDDGTYRRILDRWEIGYGAVSEAKSNQEILDGR